jgi:anti-sigma factor RsiW
MNCKTVQSNLSAYLDRELSGDEMLQIRSHLSTCPDCREEEQDLRSLKALLGGVRAAEPTADFERRLSSVIHQAKTQQTTRAWKSSVLIFAAIAACTMAMTLSYMGPSHRGQTSDADAKNRNIAFEVQRDQAYSAGGDPYGGPTVISPASYGGH